MNAELGANLTWNETIKPTTGLSVPHISVRYRDFTLLLPFIDFSKLWARK